MRLACALLLALELGCTKQPQPKVQEGPGLSQGLQCGPGSQAMTIRKGESLYKSPDHGEVITFTGDDTPVCAVKSDNTIFYLVALPDGVQGYADERSFYKVQSAGAPDAG
jgi:hypothetical protein